MRRLLVAAALVLGAGCWHVPDAFTCVGDPQCSTGDPTQPGHCEVDDDGVGYCSYEVPPTECASHRRYAHYSGPHADQCVAGQAPDAGVPDLVAPDLIATHD